MNVVNENELRQPNVAVFVSRRVINNLKSQKGKRYFRIRKLVEVNEIAKTALYLFSYQDVDFKNLSVNGIFYDKEKRKWTEKTFPFPDVLYDRVKGRSRKRLKLNYVRDKFQEMGIKKINPLDYFDKWELYQLLKKSDNIRPHLPYTRCLESTEDLKILLNISSCIYLKACRGSRGKQVMSISRLSKNRYEYRFYSKNIVVGEAKDLYALFRVIHSFFHGRKVLVQQAINLLTIDNQIVDIRGELQRNGDGVLEVTAAPVRIGTKYAPIATRGKSYPFEVVFKKYLHFTDEEIDNFKNQVDSFMIQVYQYIEQTYGNFGEIGIDIGIDKKGKIWLIECNSKSAKVSMCRTGDKETITKGFLNPLQYARYICSPLSSSNNTF